jgi:hypothetical protein
MLATTFKPGKRGAKAIKQVCDTNVAWSQKNFCVPISVCRKKTTSEFDSIDSVVTSSTKRSYCIRMTFDSNGNAIRFDSLFAAKQFVR